MRLHRVLTTALVFCTMIPAASVFPSEIGFSIGSSSQASDFATPFDYYYEVNNNPLDPITGADISSELRRIHSGGGSFGGRSGASYLGFLLVNDLPVKGFELEHDFYVTLGAEQSIKKHSLAYAANINYVLPCYPEIMIWRMKPFVGAGAGYAYRFGTNKDFIFSKLLDYRGNFQFDFGGGAKIQIYENWWLRWSIRDTVTPSMKRLDKVSPGTIPPAGGSIGASLFTTVRQTVHHISVVFSIVSIRNYQAETAGE